MNRHSGFTMVELVVTLLIVGILAAVAIPRLTINSDFDHRAFHDEVKATLRYAQKRAIASRRNVCVTFTANSVTLTAARNAGPAAACDLNLPGLDGNVPYTITANTDTAFAALPANLLIFDAQGNPSNGRQVIQVKDLPLVITVNQVTGYVE